MPRKIGFTVVSSSSHEDNFSAKELMVHAPTVNGWRSSRLCSYPQHITLQLVERSRVRKLQLLAHQYMISTKVEFYIGDTLPETSSPGFPRQLHRLGYVSLSDNEKTGFKARELKSVHVDAVGTYLRITFHRNYGNRYNHHNQVGLVAINVLGDALDGNAFNTIPSREQLIEHYLNSTQLEAALESTFMGKCESISPLDDLAFDMYQDPEVAHIIRLLDQKKQEMVRQEKYEEAKNLKQAIADLQKVGERLARYDVEKRCAIEKEDYDLAKKKKELMEEYRKSVYQQLEVHNLLDMTMVTRAAESTLAQYSPPVLSSSGRSSVYTKPLVSTDAISKGKNPDIHKNQQLAEESITSNLSSQPDTPCTPAAVLKIDVTSVPYDERPLPALQRKDQPLEATQSPAEEHSPISEVQRTPQSTEMSGEPEPLTEKVLREAGLSIEVFGESLVAGVYSKTWCYRVDALLSVYKKLLEVSPTTPKEELRNMIRAAVFLVKKALLDKVTSFCTAALAHSASTVRELAVRIILSVYQKERSAVLIYLPPNDAAVRKNFLYKNLFDGFAKIDGKLVETQTLKKGGGQPDGQKEKEEIHSLQEQLAALKEITERGNESSKGQIAKREVHKAEKDSQKAGKGTVTKGSQNKRMESCDVQQSINCLDNLCIFCGKKDESFTEDGLDLHYWKHCPMLQRCDECRQVVEIASLTEHLLGECENRSKFSHCPLCSEAVASEDLVHHAQGPGCNPPVLGKGSNHCPLCHNNFTPGEEAWKAHLMGREGCKQNSRRTAASQRTQPAQGRAFGGTKLKQVRSYGARARPMGRGSRIPSLAPLARGYPPGKR
ncbi:centrosomal protein of 104 kDa isoform X2 [Pundamilia nyererei]|uniref:Centrosomal protein of 104 kDa isoform X2 n=1 Tax=Pundamilia nyererei TaxID=303518 RepID=A0A9Y3R4Z5_9CICH|nr:PREDICTED: centrosomal protein of 104 kDa isoform X2 [Pundamilia nyererei]